MLEGETEGGRGKHVSGASSDGVEDASLWTPLLSHAGADGHDEKELGGMLLCHLAVALYAGSAHDITRRRRLIPEGQEGGVPALGSGGSSDKSGRACVGIIPGIRELGSRPQCAAY